MAKGTRLLNILVDERIVDAEEVQVLARKGHTVTPMDLAGYDLVFGPACWRMTPQLIKYLDMAVKQAREERHGKVKRKDKAA